MENKLENLLNSLVEAGWKPRGLLNEIEYIHAFDDVNQGWRVEISYGDHGYYKALRQIVSKESGLWQFVCENGMINVPHPNKGKYPRDKLEREQYKYWDRTIGYYGEDNLDRMGYSWDKYQYRLIESALKDESELEDFLLNSISLHE